MNMGGKGRKKSKRKWWYREEESRSRSRRGRTEIRYGKEKQMVIKHRKTNQTKV